MALCDRDPQLRDDRLNALELAAVDLASGKLREEPLRHPVEFLIHVGELGYGAGLCESHEINKPHQMHTALGAPPQFAQ